MNLDDWFLTPAERGNPATTIDRRHPDGTGWTRFNRVEVLIDGATYFQRLGSAIRELGPGDLVYFADWQGDGDECLDLGGVSVATEFAAAAQRGADVRGLLWRSHPRQAHFAEQDNASFAKSVDQAGGQIILDERVRRGGSHHQKLVIIRHGVRPDDDVAFEGGIDLCHGRRDDARHRGDPQAIALDARYGKRPPWHDVQLEVRGPAVADLEHTFRERWEDPTPLDHRNPWRAAVRHLTRQPRHPDPLPRERDGGTESGTHSVQVLRTYPSKRPRYPFAPDGERSIARAYLKAIGRARKLVYLEDQYLWSEHAAYALADALERHRELRVVAVVPRYPDRDGRASGAAARVGRQRVIQILRRAGGDRVSVYDLENESGTPIYVHAKVCVIDDVFLVVGSDNLNRRSWTHDSEISCSVLDELRDDRSPADPGGLGDGARRLARDTRLRLWREHLGRAVDDDDDDLLDLVDGCNALSRSARDVDDWYRGGCDGPRPPGRLRLHLPEHVRTWTRGIARTLYRFALDPDGRPRDLRRTNNL